MTNKSAVAGILGALAAGVAIGLLVAPGKGSDTRKRISAKAGSLADGLAHLWRKNGNHKLSEGARQTRSATRRTLATGKA